MERQIGTCIGGGPVCPSRVFTVMQYLPQLTSDHQKEVVEMEIAREVSTFLDLRGPATIGMLRNAINRGYHAIVKALDQLRAEGRVFGLVPDAIPTKRISPGKITWVLLEPVMAGAPHLYQEFALESDWEPW